MKTLSITLYMSEIMYDFQNKAYLTGRSRRAEGKDAEVASNMQASDDEEDKNQALRSIQNAYAQLLVELGEGVINSTDASSDNKLIGENNITLKLNVPSNFNVGLKDSLAANIHDYIINKALMDWFLITNTDDAKNYADVSAAAIKNIHETFNRRVRPTRTNV